MGKHRRLFRVLIVAGGLVLLIVVLAGIKGAQIGMLIGMGKQMEKMGPPPEPVGTTVAEGETWETTLSAVGSVSSLRSVNVSNEVPGIVSRIRFESGRSRGRARCWWSWTPASSAPSSRRRRRARDLAARTAKRSAVLAAGNVISRAQLDEIEAQLKTAHTDVAGLQAQVDRKVVRAPFTGRLGIRAVNLGQYLTPGTTITTLDAIGATFVDFTLPQEDLALVSVGLPVRVTFEGSTEKARRDDHRGRSDRRPDDPQRQGPRRPSPNRSAKPRPGMFVNVQVILPKQQAVVAVPPPRSSTRRTAIRCSWSSRRSRARPGWTRRPTASRSRSRASSSCGSVRRAATSSPSPRGSRPGRRS